VPKPVRGSWKIWYRVDQLQTDGSIRRFQRTKALGRVSEMTASEARAAALRFVQPFNDRVVGVEFRGHTLEALAARWEQTVARTLRAETRRSYRWASARILARFGQIRVSEIGRGDIEAFLIDAKAEGLSTSAVATIQGRLKALFSCAVDWEWLAVSPVRGRFRLGTPQKVRPKTILSRAEIEALLDQLDPPYDAMVLLGVYAGLRKGEIGGLQWRDVREGEVLIRRAVIRGQVGPAKTPGSETAAPIGPRTARALAAWRQKTRFPRPEDWVFASPKGGPVNLDGVAAKGLKPVGRKLGIEPLAWHDLRHTFVTLGRRAGIAPEVMQRLARHADVRTTLGVYSHLVEEGAVGRIESGELLPGVTQPSGEVA
jgi:integrase